jgi:hypothetical protein
MVDECGADRAGNPTCAELCDATRKRTSLRQTNPVKPAGSFISGLGFTKL